MCAAAFTKESRRVYLGRLREQLDTIDWTQQMVKSQAEELEAGGLNESIDKLRLASLRLAEAHTALREVFGSLARPLLRPLKIHDLPDELLMDIFGYLRKRADIKRLRLSSRRLNTTSSHLLMDTIQVDLNPKSLERLEDISRHPAISRGLRRLVISVDVYDATLAKDVWRFHQDCIGRLGRLYQSMPSNHIYRNVLAWIQNSQLELSLALEDGDIEGINYEVARIVHNGWLRYRQLYHEQQMVISDSRLPQAVASAVSRMTCINKLVIKDRSYRSDKGWTRTSITRQKVESLAKDRTRLVKEIMPLTLPWQQLGAADLPFQLLCQIPLAIHATGFLLSRLKFDLTTLKGLQLQIDSDQMSRLKSFGQSLKSFEYNGRSRLIDWWPPERAAGEDEDFHKFLTAFTRSSNLVSAALEFDFKQGDSRFHDLYRVSDERLLSSLHSHELRSIHLKNCSTSLTGLRILAGLSRKEPAVLGLSHIYLFNGNWADAVDLLHAEVQRGRLSQKTYVTCPDGAECLSVIDAPAEAL